MYNVSEQRDKNFEESYNFENNRERWEDDNTLESPILKIVRLAIQSYGEKTSKVKQFVRVEKTFHGA